MEAPSLSDREVQAAHSPNPSLSYSRINRYLTCPEQYRLHYLERLRPRFDNASLVFGTVIHLALADFFRNGEDPVEHFRRDWQKLKDIRLAYKHRESWEGFSEKGEKLLTKFVAEEAHKIQDALGIERKFELRMTVLGEPFIGSIDLVARMDNRKTVVDFKTAGSDYEEHEAPLSDQLTAYALAEPDAEQVALCVFIKTKEPRIEWHFAKRNADDMTDYLTKVQIVAEDIASGKFYKRIGKHCSYCDYLPVCLGDEKKAQETLVRIA